MSYTTTTYLYFGVPITEEQANALEGADLPEHVEVFGVGCGMTGEGHQDYLCCYVRECSWWSLSLDSKALDKRVDASARRALESLLHANGIQAKPGWFIGQWRG